MLTRIRAKFTHTHTATLYACPTPGHPASVITLIERCTGCGKTLRTWKPVMR